MNKLIVAMMVIAVAATSCKDDNEEDLLPQPSTLTGLVINEIMSAPETGSDWIELYNNTDQEIDLGGFRLQDDKGAAEEYVIPAGTKIAAKAILVFEQGTSFEFGLSSGGDLVILLDKSDAEVNRVTVPGFGTDKGKSYGRTTDGGQEFKVFDIPTKGVSNTGTPPVEEDPEKSLLKLFINEVQSAPAGDDMDFIEIYNAEDREINIGGFILMDDKGAAEQFVIPADTKIASKGLVVFSQVSPGAGVGFTFGLGSKGDKVTFTEADGKKIIDMVETPNFGDTKGQSYSRIGNGGVQWQIVDTPTKGKDNEKAPVISLAGKIVINEVYTFSNQSVVEDLDWIELYNTTDEAVVVGGLMLWESGGSAEAWVIPAGKSIPAKGRLLIESDKYKLHNDTVNYPMWGLSKGPDEYVVLADAGMNWIDSVACPSMNANESYGRVSDGAAKWQIFAQYTKGTANTGNARPEQSNQTGLYINEVYHDNQKTAIPGIDWNTENDFIELYNKNNTPLDISGWEIYDDTDDDTKKYVIPAGTIVPANGYLVYDVFKENPAGPSFGLGVGGDWVFIYKPGKSELVDKMEVPGFGKDSGLRDKGYTFGRLTDGSSDLVIFRDASKGKSNNGKAIISQE